MKTEMTAEEAVEFLRTLMPNTGLNAPASLRLRQAADLITRQAEEIERLRASDDLPPLTSEQFRKAMDFIEVADALPKPSTPSTPLQPPAAEE